MKLLSPENGQDFRVHQGIERFNVLLQPCVGWEGRKRLLRSSLILVRWPLAWQTVGPNYGFPGEAPTLQELLKAFLEAESTALDDAGLVAVLEAVAVASVVKA
ncbi:unnamed protein product [Clonostachys solani]|uniref:Uncharacterized protein n=1 Tax=Clonostachys solani TaxID=160281 RepID=A0A9N9ZBQ0_9HYPO|nr:unnamed protein product [Clonostachys solani]